MPKFERQWKYQSNHPDPVAVATNATAPTLVPWSPVVRGTILQTSADIAKTNPQPMLTTGFFVLEPLQ